MGTSLEIKVESRSDVAAHHAEEAVLAEIARLSKILSGYDPDSEFSRRFARVRGPDQSVSRADRGADRVRRLADEDIRALDPSAEAFSALWNMPRSKAGSRALPNCRPPSTACISATGSSIPCFDRYPHERRAAAAELLHQELHRRLRGREAIRIRWRERGLINSGGDVVVRGNWTQTIGIADPAANADNAAPLGVVAVHDAVVATSGGYKRGFEIAGRHYSHVIDPRSGQPAGRVLSATVVSASAIDAGALATAFCVLSPAESAAVATRLAGVEFMLCSTTAASREQRLAQPRARPGSASGTGRRGCNALRRRTGDVDPGLAAGRHAAARRWRWRRPYVACGSRTRIIFPVRTVSLWYDGKSRYLPELRAWSRADRLRAMAEGSQIVDTVTSATRPAGKIHRSMGRQGQRGEIRQRRHLHRLHRGGTRTRHLSNHPAGHRPLRRGETPGPARGHRNQCSNPRLSTGRPLTPAGSVRSRRRPLSA